MYGVLAKDLQLKHRRVVRQTHQRAFFGTGFPGSCVQALAQAPVCQDATVGACPYEKSVGPGLGDAYACTRAGRAPPAPLNANDFRTGPAGLYAFGFWVPCFLFSKWCV